MNWQARKAELEDVDGIVGLARNYDSFLMPYVLNRFVVSNYIDQFMVAEKLSATEWELGGAVHCLTSKGKGVGPFLLLVKQVPSSVVSAFVTSTSEIGFLGQIVCPGKGTFYTILEKLKKQYDELWCWMSVVGPSYKSYDRYDFRFEREQKFWNIYKRDYSTFVWMKWIK